jgi:hypothetical protein
MFSPFTPVKFVLPVKPKRMAFGECRCGGIISCGMLIRYAANSVVTVATVGSNAGFAIKIERRSEISIGMSSAASSRTGWMSLYLQRYGTAGFLSARNRSVA